MEKQSSSHPDRSDSLPSSINGEQSIRYIIEITRIGLWHWDLQEHWIDCSSITRELFDFPADLTITFDIFLERVHPDDRERVAHAVRHSLAEQKEYTAEYRIVWSDGSIHWIAARGYGSEYDAQGKPKRMVGVVANNDERMYLADRLREQTDELNKALRRSQIILESINDIFVSIDQGNRFLHINQQAMQILKQPPQTLLGKRIEEAFPMYTGSILEALIQKARRTGEPQKIVGIYLETFNQWFTISIYPEQGEISMYAQNVTELIHSEKALQVSEVRFRRLVDSNIIGFFEVDPQGYLLEANEAFLNSLGYSKDEFIPSKLHWKEITPASSHYLEESIGKEILEKGRTQTYELNLKNNLGNAVPVIMTGTLLNDHTGRQIWLTLDVTAQKELEKQREKFINMAGHELRNPLASVKGNLELLLRKMRRVKNSEKTISTDHIEGWFLYLDRALAQISAEDRIIEDLLDSTRATTDHIKINRQPHRIDMLVKEVIRDLRLQHPQRELRLAIPMEIHSFVLMDCDRIKQVMNNLITNAIKYSPEDQPIAVKLVQEQQQALLEVEDKGSGLTEDELHKIWTPYYQTGTKAPEQKGLGLGLHITQKIVTEHGGTIGARSEPKQGSTFWFTLPFIQ